MIDKAEDVLRNWPGDFVQRGQDPMAWSYQAEILKSAARAVLQKAKEDRTTGVIAERWVDAVYKSLVGTALENLLKAMMVRNDKSLIGKNKGVYKIAGELKHHDIWSLYANNDARLQNVVADDGTKQVTKEVLSKDEQDLLGVVEDYVVWIGRFPIATNETAFKQNIDSVKNSRLANLSLDEFDALFEATYMKLMSLALGVNLKKTSSLPE